MKYLCLSLLLSLASYAASPYIVKGTTLYESGYEIGVDSKVFQSTAIKDFDGNTVEYSDGESYMQFDLDIYARYGFTNNLEMTLGTTVRYNNSVQAIEVNSDPIEDYGFTATGIKSAWGQVRYSFPMSGSKILSAHFTYEKNFATNSEYKGFEEPDQIVLGDDGQFMATGLSFTYLTKSQNFFSIEGIFRSPGANLSNEVFIAAEAGLAWRSFALFLGFENVSSMNQDTYADDPNDKPLIDSGNTGLYNSINRSWLEPYMGMGLSISEKWRIEGKYSQRISGVSTDLGSSFQLLLASRKSQSKSVANKRSAFKEYEVESEVVKTSKSGKSVIIAAGLADDVDKGSKIDFYYFDYLDGSELIASGFVVKAGAKKSMVKITKRYSKRRVKLGTTARAGLIN